MIGDYIRMNKMSTILRAATRQDSEPINVLTADTHEAYQTNMSKTNCNFYSFPHQSFKVWNPTYRPVPHNYTILTEQKLPMVDFDVVISQNKFGQFQVLADLANQLSLPLISLEHTLPVPMWSPQILDGCTKMRGHLNVFISEYSVSKWGFTIEDPTVRVVHHGIDTELFKPSDKERQNKILCVVNDWMNRDWCCNFQGFMRTAQNLPVTIVGDTPGLSLPSPSVEALVESYATNRIFYNTSTISPVPTAMMEAMSCGCAIVSTATCMIPEIIEHGVDGFISNDEEELKKYLMLLMSDAKLAEEMGKKAREKIVTKFNVSQFVNGWNSIIKECSEILCR